MAINDTLTKLDNHTANANSIYEHFKNIYFKKHCISFYEAHDRTHKDVLEWHKQRDKVFDRYDREGQTCYTSTTVIVMVDRND